jgi:NAD(P)-dependent dehydrogenase (short-subunit alcohol dehydrogenase family)
MCVCVYVWYGFVSLLVLSVRVCRQATTQHNTTSNVEHFTHCQLITVTTPYYYIYLPSHCFCRGCYIILTPHTHTHHHEMNVPSMSIPSWSDTKEAVAEHPYTAAAVGVAALSILTTGIKTAMKWIRTDSKLVDRANNGLNVVITGSTRGFGLALAKELLRLGHNVVITGRNQMRTERAYRAVRKEFKHCLGDDKQKLSCCTCNVQEYHAIDVLAKTAIRELGGPIDIWINNAAIKDAPTAKLIDTSAENLKEVCHTNLIGTALGCRGALRVMIKQGFGAIFNVDGSGSRGVATPNAVAYGMTKAAIPQLGKTVAAESRGTGVSVHTISPGMILTPLLLHGNEDKTHIFNILCEEPDTVAHWIVPKLIEAYTQGERGTQAYIRYLTPLGAMWRFATAPFRKHRFFDKDGKRHGEE